MRLFIFLLILLSAAPAVADPTRDFTLGSGDMKPGAMMPLRHVGSAPGCFGENIAPVMSWFSPPFGTQSYALLMFDPDAPEQSPAPGQAKKGKGFFHWLVVDIPGMARTLPARLPLGARTLTNDYGNARYDGPCPPKGQGTHRYQFILHALDVPRLKVAADMTGRELLRHLKGHTLGISYFVAVYGR